MTSSSCAKLRGKDVQITHGLAETLAQTGQARRRSSWPKSRTFLDSLVSHYVLDDGKLVVAHAGMKAEMAGRGSGRVREFALYGETTGETDEFGLPIRYPWAENYRGAAECRLRPHADPDPRMAEPHDQH